MENVIQSMWIGPTLTVLEQLAIRSFQRHGHEFHLYVYEEVDCVPVGTVVRDGNEVLPSSMIFQYTDHASYSAFSNFFRYKLLLEKGGWWVDTDVVCLRPFDFGDEYVLSTELDGPSGEVPDTAVIKCPAGSQLMADAWRECQQKPRSSLVWGEIGPRMFGESVRRCGLQQWLRPHHTFCPIAFDDWEQVLAPEHPWEFDRGVYAIHLWNEMWRRAGRDKSGDYPPTCLFEHLKATYL